MNRLKVLLYAVLVLAAVGLAVYQGMRWLSERALSHVDQDLKAAAAQADVRLQLVAADAAQLSDSLSRDPAVVQALASGNESDALAAARTIVAAAEAKAPDRPRPLLLAVSLRGGTTFSSSGSPVPADKEGADLLLAAASEGTQKEGHVLAAEVLYALVARPVARDASVAIGVPVGPSLLSEVRATSGADLTLLVGGNPLKSTLASDQALLVAKAAGRSGGKIVDAGALGGVPSPQGTPWPELPALLIMAPAYRVEAVALKGLPGGLMALSLPTRGTFAPVVWVEWLFALVLVGLALAGLIAVLLVVNEQKTVVSRQLLATADRIARGDFSARVDVLAGSLGSIATALNRAAEAAERGNLAPAPSLTVPESERDILPPMPSSLRAPEPPREERVEASPPAEPLLPRMSLPDSDLATGAWVGALREPPPAEPTGSFASAGDATASEPWTASEPPAEPAEMAPAGRIDTGEPPPAAPPEEAPLRDEPAPPQAANPDEEHWQVVYQDFIAARKQSGESVEGVTYERFRVKLKQQRDQLVAKYACKTARFQVYLKQGRAALKASPVR
jgi:hypothetical protein